MKNSFQVSISVPNVENSFRYIFIFLNIFVIRFPEMVSRKQLAGEYGITIKTLAVWLKMVKGVKNITKRRKFTHKEAELIYAHLGEP